MTAVKKEPKQPSDPDKTQIRSIVAVDDVEPAKKSTDVISDARIAMLESLSDGISHELNSPLQILSDSIHQRADSSYAGTRSKRPWSDSRCDCDVQDFCRAE